MNEEVINIVISYAEEMNEWEHKMYLLSRKEYGEVINHEEDRKIIPKVTLKEYEKIYYEIFEKYCTSKKRVYGGFPSSFERHGQYRGINKKSIVSSNIINKKRIEVIANGGVYPGNKFLFVLMFKNNEWKIDSAKTQLEEGDEWSLHHL